VTPVVPSRGLLACSDWQTHHGRLTNHWGWSETILALRKAGLRDSLLQHRPWVTASLFRCRHDRVFGGYDLPW